MGEDLCTTYIQLSPFFKLAFKQYLDIYLCNVSLIIKEKKIPHCRLIQVPRAN